MNINTIEVLGNKWFREEIGIEVGTFMNTNMLNQLLRKNRIVGRRNVEAVQDSLGKFLSNSSNSVIKRFIEQGIIIVFDTNYGYAIDEDNNVIHAWNIKEEEIA